MSRPVPVAMPSPKHDLTGLIRSHDRKVASVMTPGGDSSIANAFGLPAGKAYSCRGATSVCESVCYAGRLEGAYPEVLPVVMHNYRLLTATDRRGQTALLARMVGEYVKQCDRRNVPDARRVFRIHWDGDFFSDPYTRAWRDVIATHPGVRFWCYTRVASSARILHRADLPNLALYYSADRVNLLTARRLRAEGIRLAYLDTTMADGVSIVGRGVQCPENLGRLPMAGACMACGACIRGRSDVLFASSRR